MNVMLLFPWDRQAKFGRGWGGSMAVVKWASEPGAGLLSDLPRYRISGKELLALLYKRRS